MNKQAGLLNILYNEFKGLEVLTINDRSLFRFVYNSKFKYIAIDILFFKFAW